MNEGRIAQKAARMRQLGDGKADATRAQCLEAAEYWGDSAALTKLAEYLGATRTKLLKWSGAGALMEAEIAGEDWPVELGYQVALWEQNLWETVADMVSLAGLNASELKALRLTHYKLTDVRLTVYMGAGGFSVEECQNESA